MACFRFTYFSLFCLVVTCVAASIQARASCFDGCVDDMDIKQVSLVQRTSVRRKPLRTSEQSLVFWHPLWQFFQSPKFGTSAQVLRHIEPVNGGVSTVCLNFLAMVSKILVIGLGFIFLCFALVFLTTRDVFAWLPWIRSSMDVESIRGEGVPASMVAVIFVTGICSQCVSDQYLPSIPQMAQDFNVPEEILSLSINVNGFANAITSFFFGFLVDRLGRKPFIVGLNVLLCLSTLSCGCATSVSWFMAARVLQGIAEGGFACTFAGVARDCYEDPAKRAEFTATLLIIFTMGPVLAPVFGGLIAARMGWRFPFFMLAGLALLNSFAAKYYFIESLKAESKTQAANRTICTDIFSIVSDRGLFALMLVNATLSAYGPVLDSNSANILETGYGMTTHNASLGIGLYALGIFGAGLVGLVKKLSPLTACKYLFTLLVIPIALNLIFASKLASSSTWFLVISALNFFFIIPCLIVSQSIFLQPCEHMAGFAGALFNSVGLFMGHSLAAVGIPLVNSAGIESASSMLLLYSAGIIAVAKAAFWLGIGLWPAKWVEEIKELPEG